VLLVGALSILFIIKNDRDKEEFESFIGRNSTGSEASSTSVLTCDSEATLALVERIIDNEEIDIVIKTKMISLPRFRQYLANVSSPGSVQFSQKALSYKFGSKGTAKAPHECFAELSIKGSVVVNGSSVGVSLDKQTVEYSIIRNNDGTDGVIMDPLNSIVLFNVKIE
jgi:hypothetical protein